MIRESYLYHEFHYVIMRLVIMSINGYILEKFILNERNHKLFDSKVYEIRNYNTSIHRYIDLVKNFIQFINFNVTALFKSSGSFRFGVTAFTKIHIEG